MKRNLLILILLIAQALSSCASTPSALPGIEVSEVTMQDLLDRPLDFDGKRIKVSGWVTLEPENYNVWKLKSDIDDFNVFNCISLQNYDGFLAKPSKFNRRKVLLTGIFYADVTKGSPKIRLNACAKAAIALDHPYQLRLLD